MATFDKVIKGGIVIDGRNLPRKRADVGIKDGRIARIGNIRSSDAGEVLDASGMIVAPGFVDLHTHYDAQLFWDPYCTLSGWHGVTSVAIGNCGFGFAPARPEDRAYLMASLTRVEAIPHTCIERSLPWTWQTFPEWLDVIDRQPKGLNVLSYVPLNPLLVHVMGYDAAKSRDATPAERDEMCRLLTEAIDAGACGWSAQRSAPGTGFDVQRDFDGSPFATDLMSKDTALALGAALAPYDHTFIQTLMLTEDPAGDLAHLEELARVSRSAILFNAVGTDPRNPDAHRFILSWIRQCQERGLSLYAQCVTSGARFTFTFENWNMWDDSPPWREATLGTPAERLAKFRDPARRKAMIAHPPALFPIAHTTLLETKTERFRSVMDMLVPDAARILGYADPTELLLDIVVEDELQTLLQVPQVNQDPALQAELVVAPYALWGLSDGGAHTKFITLGAYPTESITDFVRERHLVSLEEAHWRLSALPASAAGFRDRGTLALGAPADVIVYDYENLKALPEEIAEDLPGGEWRRIRRAEGYRYVLVNGETTFVEGRSTGATPGRLLRHGEG